LSLPTFFNALKWSVAGELASKAIQPLVFVILARILVPDDYGVVAAAIMVISFTQVFWEAGMSKALIQRQQDIDAAANVAFWVNIGMAIIVTALLFLFSDFIAKVFFHDVRVARVLQVMTLQVFLGAVASIHTALLQKEMKFNRLFWVRITTVAVPGLFSIPLALYGMSYWALVIGTLVGQAAQVVVLWRISVWRPKLTFDKQLAKELGRFGIWVGLSGLLSWFYIWIDSLFVGSYLGTYQLGLYRTGNQFVTMIFGFLFAPILPVLYSHFSGIQWDKEKLRDVLFKVIRIITLIAIPLAFFLYALADPIRIVVFGEKWKGVEFVIGVMALMHGFSWVVGANGEVYRAIGKPSYETIVTSTTLVIYLAGYFISIRHGFEAFVWTRYFLAMLAMFIHIYFGWRAVHLSIPSLLRIIITATFIGSIAVMLKMLVTLYTQNPFVQIAWVSCGSGIFTLAVLFLLERNGLIKDLSSLWSKRSIA
jgi:O-antigen/teichoic acid export membrane protein